MRGSGFLPGSARDETGTRCDGDGMPSIRTRTLAELYIRQGHPGKAAEILEEIIKDHPRDPELEALLKTARAAENAQKLPAGEPEFCPMPEMTPAPEPVSAVRLAGNSTPPATFTEKVVDLGAAAVEEVTTLAMARLQGMLNRVRERRRR